MGGDGSLSPVSFLCAVQPLHDPCAVAYVIAPALFEARRMAVAVETASPHSYGQTVCDQYNLGRRPDSAKNVNVALRMDVPAFWRMLLDACALANAASPLNHPQ